MDGSTSVTVARLPVANRPDSRESLEKAEKGGSKRKRDGPFINRKQYCGRLSFKLGQCQRPRGVRTDCGNAKGRNGARLPA